MEHKASSFIHMELSTSSLQEVKWLVTSIRRKRESWQDHFQFVDQMFLSLLMCNTLLFHLNCGHLTRFFCAAFITKLKKGDPQLDLGAFHNKVDMIVQCRGRHHVEW